MDKKYIEKEKVLKLIESGMAWNWGYNTLYDEVENLQAADVVEVVRCKNCVKRQAPDCAMWYQCSICGGQWSWETDDVFCSFGEKRVDNG